MNCFMCKGSMIDSMTNHVVNLKNCVIIVKNVPCTECTQCGESYYDDEITSRLEEIVKRLKDSFTEVAIINYADNVALY